MRPVSTTLILTLGAFNLAVSSVPCWAQSDQKADAIADTVQDVEPSKSNGILPIRNYDGDLWNRAFLTGDWGGTRTSLAQQGVSFDFTFTQTFQAIVDGGRDETERYGGKFETYTSVDMDRMGVMRGALLTMRTESRYGDSVNGNAGTILPINDVMYFPLTDERDEDILVTITELRYTQFLSSQFGLFLGKFTTLGGDFNEFAAGRGDTQFMSHGFLSASVTALMNPYSTLGAGVMWMPTDSIAVTSTIYQSADSSTTTGFNNFDDGWTWTTAARLQYQIGHLPGGVMGSFCYAFDNEFIDFSKRFINDGNLNVPTSDDSWCLYFNAWQYLFVAEHSDKPIDVTDGRIDRQGIGLFLRAAVADEDTNPIDWIVSGGISGKGVIPGRDNDTFGIGYSYNKLHEARFITGTLLDSTGSRFEGYYNLAITPAAELTFDVQVADSILTSIDPALIIGMRLRLRF